MQKLNPVHGKQTQRATFISKQVLLQYPVAEAMTVKSVSDIVLRNTFSLYHIFLRWRAQIQFCVSFVVIILFKLETSTWLLTVENREV